MVTLSSPSRRLRVLRAAALVAAALAFVAWPMAASAQDRVGLAVRGAASSVAGELEDLADGTLYIRVSLHDQRRIPIGDVLMMDFTKDRPLAIYDEIDQAAGQHQLLVLRDGRRFKGTLIGIEGGHGSSKEGQPRLVLFGPLDGGPVMQVEARSVSRLYLNDFTVSRPATTPAAPPAGAIQVPAAMRWVSTHLMVQAGETMNFSVTGRVQLSADVADVAGPAGSPLGRTSGAATMPGVLLGALIGRIGTGPPFGIGDQTVLRMPAEGELFLGVNDDRFGDNKAAFQVVVTRGGR